MSGTLVVGDVHGCAEELAALVQLAQAERVVLVGDLFTKGPDPVGVWRQIQAGGFEAVLGNHDARLLAGQAPGVAAALYGHGSWNSWLAARPLFHEVAGFTVVHAGLHPSGLLSRTPRDVALAVRRWPDDAQDSNPFWYQIYRGERRVVFGHDAMRGSVRVERDGQPWCVGLDTGCVYGGALTGYLLEDDVLLSAPAARAYRQV